MPGSGTENRQRQISLKARFTDAEAALIRTQAERAGISVAALIRHAVLDQKPLRASRTPPLDRVEAARLIAALGSLATALRDVADDAAFSADDPHRAALDAAFRDLAELRLLTLEAMGRAP